MLTYCRLYDRHHDVRSRSVALLVHATNIRLQLKPLLGCRSQLNVGLQNKVLVTRCNVSATNDYDLNLGNIIY